MNKTGTLPTPDQTLEHLWKRVPGYIQLTFVSAIVCGLIGHLYMFANKFPNHDDLHHILGMDYGTASGRWFLPFAASLDGDYSMPWLIGVLSILCLALTACFVVSLFRVRSKGGCIVTAALVTCFPTVTATFSYMFTADAYFFSTMLAAFGAYAAVRWRGWGSLVGVISITLSLGIYQSYFGVAAALMVGALIFEVLDGDKSFKELMIRGIKLAAVLAVAMAAYFILVKITTMNEPLVDYMGISEMGKISLAELPQQILMSYGKFFTFYLENDSGFHFNILRLLFPVAALCALVCFVLVLCRKKLGGLRTALACVLLLLLPLAADIIYVMVPGGMVHSLMLFGLMLPLPFMLGLADYTWSQGAVELPRGQRTACAAMSWAILLTLLMSAYSYVIVDNKAYLKMDISYQQTLAYSNRLVSAVEQAEGYQEGMPVFLVGHADEHSFENPTQALDEINMTGVMDLAAYRNSYTYGQILRAALAFRGEVGRIATIDGLSPELQEEVAQMPTYPAQGSVRVLDGAAYVMLGGV